MIKWGLIITWLIVAGCASSATPTAIEAIETIEPTIEAEMPARPEPFTIDDEKLYIALIWHQHQPVYFKDELTGVYEKPWVRVHAAKDYVDMAAMLQKYPDIHATFNLTPSLIRQLDDISAGAKDLYWIHAEIPPAELSDEQKQLILDRFFDINPKIIARFPRYTELVRQRNSTAASEWTEQDWIDLQVLFNLAWTDPLWLESQPLASLVERGRDFTEQDKETVFSEHLRLVQEVIPLHADMQREGQIEVTMTPFAHPILPLLVDSNLAQVALPDAELPSRFIYGQDAVAQVELGVDFYRDHFGERPRGMWPAEGSVAESIVTMVDKAGIQWMASDEEVLAKSLPQLEAFTRDAEDLVIQADDLYRAYAVEGARGGPVAILFRDHLLSDKVGFEYSGTPGAEAAADLVERLEAIHQKLLDEDTEGSHLVTVLLDGENAWEHYDNDGKEFLHEMYRLLSDSDTLITVTPSQYLEALDVRGDELPVIDELWPGSWIDGTFSTWIGEAEENQGWEYLLDTRRAIQEAEERLGDDTLRQAMELMYIAEGSDWFWWYGADQNSGSDDSFDRQFRAYLESIYQTIGDEVPDFVHVPVIPTSPQIPDRQPENLLAAEADGVVHSGEWEEAGLFSLDSPGLAALHYGFDQENLFLRLDAPDGFSKDQALGFYIDSPGRKPANAYSRHGPGETVLGFGVNDLVEVTFTDLALQVQAYEADGAGGWSATRAEATQSISIAAGIELLEMVIPIAQIAPDARSGDRLNIRLVVSDSSGDLAVFPEQGPLLATVPDLPIPNVFAEFTDPTGDDHGPGGYTYPSDQVFKAGVYDLTGFTIGQDDNDYIFRLQFRGPVINEWSSPNGLSVQTIDIYIDSDGSVHGERLLLPGRNAALPEDSAWDYAVWAEGWTPGVFEPGPEGPLQIDTGYRIVTNPGQHRVTIYVPRHLLDSDPSNWRIAVAVLSQEGFPSAGVWRVRDVLPTAEQWRIGGGSGSPADTRILDILWPSDRSISQEEYLVNSNPPDRALAEISADELPTIPMLLLSQDSSE